MSRLVGYARFSKADSGQVLDHQLDALEAAGVKLVLGETFFKDEGVSGKLESRPGFDACKEALQTGDTLVVYRLDRLGRSTAHLLTTIKELTDRGVGFRSLKEGFDVTTPVGRLVCSMLASIAEFEREVIVERIKDRLASKKARGESVGRPLSLKPSQIEAAQEFIAGGRSLAEAARLFDVDKSTLWRALRRAEAMQQ